jgi:hypothetical protein
MGKALRRRMAAFVGTTSAFKATKQWNCQESDRLHTIAATTKR